MWGVIPAAGAGTRIQPLAFSKELLPIGSRLENNVERPRAVSEYLIERMINGGITKLCFVISPGKSDIMSYYGGKISGVDVIYVVQPNPAGLCDALFRATPFIDANEQVLVGLPDTIWYPVDGFARLNDDDFSFLLFPVKQPELFDAVVVDGEGHVVQIQVKRPKPSSSWIWGAFKLRGSTYRELQDLWLQPERGDEYIGTLVNSYLARGGTAKGVKAGETYVDVGTLNGYREATRLLSERADHDATFSITPRRNAKANPAAETVHL
jgi:dTDP-glucose pyrophosphorylase